MVNNKAVPRATQVYMFGSYPPRIIELLSDAERASMFWELAVGYLEGIARDSRGYAELTRQERERFWRQWAAAARQASARDAKRRSPRRPHGAR